jgi:hypothetical protein
MARHLNLVQSDFEQLEKKIFPRFPFCYLIFKSTQYETHVFEVKDISQTGMQLGLKDGEHNLKDESQISGSIHWNGSQIDIAGDIKWTTDSRLGVEFSHKPSQRTQVDTFLSVQNFAKNLKPIHKIDYGSDLPTKLKYWLRSDGPVEVFVWQHSNGELAAFELLIMENYIEWADGQGLKTGRIMSKRDINTPLVDEDEFVFKIDNTVDDEKIDLACTLVTELDENKLNSETLDFIRLKLGL